MERSFGSSQGKNWGVGGVRRGHGARLLVGIEMFLANDSGEEEQVPINMQYSGDGTLLASTEFIVGQWKEYFEIQ